MSIGIDILITDHYDLYDGMAIDMLMIIITINDNWWLLTNGHTIIDSMDSTIIIANDHYNGDDDHYSNWCW